MYDEDSKGGLKDRKVGLVKCKMWRRGRGLAFFSSFVGCEVCKNEKRQMTWSGGWVFIPNHGSQRLIETAFRVGR